MTTSFLGRLALCAGLLASISACSNLDTQQQKMLSGGAAGAVIGTVGTAMTGGCIPCGTAIGAVVGTGAGYLMDHLDRSTKASTTTPSTP